jgi:hypothetical protein
MASRHERIALLQEGGGQVEAGRARHGVEGVAMTGVIVVFQMVS